MRSSLFIASPLTRMHNRQWTESLRNVLGCCSGARSILATARCAKTCFQGQYSMSWRSATSEPIPTRITNPIVVLVFRDRKVVIEGNNRVNI
jgi:hypothetical protein